MSFEGGGWARLRRLILNLAGKMLSGLEEFPTASGRGRLAHGPVGM